jgi:hypothetical protein
VFAASQKVIGSHASLARTLLSTTTITTTTITITTITITTITITITIALATTQVLLTSPSRYHACILRRPPTEVDCVLQLPRF